jgi:hypothetical protein
MKAGGSFREKRRAKRRPILEGFAIFATLEEGSPLRQTVLDISEYGIGLELELGVAAGGNAVLGARVGDLLTLRIHVNPHLYIPVTARVVRHHVEKSVSSRGAQKLRKSGVVAAAPSGVLRLGAEFVWPKDHSTDARFRALRSLSELVDALIDCSEERSAVAPRAKAKAKDMTRVRAKSRAKIAR